MTGRSTAGVATLALAVSPLAIAAAAGVSELAYYVRILAVSLGSGILTWGVSAVCSQKGRGLPRVRAALAIAAAIGFVASVALMLAGAVGVSMLASTAVIGVVAGHIGFTATHAEVKE